MGLEYSYDNFGNLTMEKAIDDDIFACNGTVIRRFGTSGNVYSSASNSERHYGAGGQLLKYDGWRCKYNDNGEMVEKTNTDGTVWKYCYHPSGLMEKVIRPDGKEVKFVYDSMGRRVGKEFDGKTTIFIWDGNNIIHEWSETLFSDTGSGAISEQTPTVFTWLYEDDSFIPLVELTGENAYSIISDHLGTPFAMLDQNGETVWEARLDIYGKTRTHSGSDIKGDTCPFRFPGQYEDEETGLYYNRFRYYMPETGLYTQCDPLGLAGCNPTVYGYVNNTLVYIDPLGLLKEFGIAGYKSKLHNKDSLTAHEVLQNAWLKHKIGIKRGTGQESRNNPAMAIQENSLHKTISALQAFYGLHDEDVLITQTALQNININARITRRAIENELFRNRGMSRTDAHKLARKLVDDLRNQAINHAISYGLIIICPK
jgi:RHS repeat-associated protein